jgi:hypothetical protein
MWLKRRWTKHQLEAIMPTVLWTPRFINYTPREDCDKSLSKQKSKMASSSITNILPKMKRLGGPYGMFATVYGVSTKVVHVGHPVPAREILNGMSKGVDDLKEGWFRGVIFRLYGPYKWLQTLGANQASPTRQQTKRRSSTLINTTGSTKNPAYDHFKNFSGDGVFTADGADWKAKRASVIHCLLGNMNDLESEVNKSADGLISELNGISEGDNAVNVVPVLQRCTIGLIYRIITHDNDAFGSDCDSSDNHRNIEYNHLTPSSPRSSATSLASMEVSSESTLESETITNFAKRSCHTKAKTNNNTINSLLTTYLQSVTQIRMIILAQSRSIWYLLPRWVYRLFSPMYREEEKVMGPIREFARMACQNARKGSPLDLLSKRASHNSNSVVDGGVPKDMLDEAITLLFAGQDTSAATLSWTLHLLSLDPIRQQRLVDEVRSVVGNDNHNSEMDFVSKTMIAQMPYLDAVIKESMRLYPVAPFVVRKLTTNITIPGEKCNDQATATILPSSTFACIWIYALHRNSELWHSPDEFIPERWIDPQLREMDAGQEEPGAYIPFAMGPRNCLGRPLAQVVLRVLLARLLNRYMVIDPRYEALKGESSTVDTKCLRKDMQAGFTVLPSNGLELMLRYKDK